MTADSSFFTCITRAVFNTASINGTYQVLNGTGFSDDIKVLKIYNAGTMGVDISYDGGVTDHDFYPPGSTMILDLQSDHADTASYGAGTLYGRKGQLIFGKGTAGVGNLYIIGYR